MRKPDEETLYVLTEIEKTAHEAMREANGMVGARMLSSVRWIRKLAQRVLRKGEHEGVPYDEEETTARARAEGFDAAMRQAARTYWYERGREVSDRFDQAVARQRQKASGR